MNVICAIRILSENPPHSMYAVLDDVIVYKFKRGNGTESLVYTSFRGIKSVINNMDFRYNNGVHWMCEISQFLSEEWEIKTLQDMRDFVNTVDMIDE
jgi:hypothetical protein